ncbi:MAG: M3 family metallopeptidase [Planctomycetota bacterium]|jgi:oligopeptidase A|nr:M3 family metallopeptidase [Planctomycetota bacterium]
MSHPLVDWDQFPPFSAVTTDGLEQAVQSALAEAEDQIAVIEAAEPDTWDGLAAALERALDPLGRVWGLVGHLTGVRNSDELRAMHERLQAPVVRFFTRVGQSLALYQAWRAVRERGGLDGPQQRIVEQAIRSAEHSGVGLSGAARDRFNAIQEQLAAIQTSFSNHVLDATKAWSEVITDLSVLAGVPATALAMLAANAGGDATAEAGPWKVTLDAPSFLAVMQHGRNRALRERVYRAYVTRAASGDLDNGPLIEQILSLRKEQVGLLGFASYAELSLSTKMAGEVPAVEALLEELWAASRPAAERDLAELIAAAEAAGAEEGNDFKPWDVAFWAERERERRFAVSDEELRPYFPLPQVLDGLFALCQRLFDIRFEAAGGEVEVWHPDVRFFRVRDASDAIIAYCYLDPYARPADKRPGAWMDVCVGASTALAPVSQARRTPVAYLVCNQTPPVGTTPSLMSFREVETMFHEFGHGLQHMLTTVPYGEAAGIEGIEWDAVELPSQFMENWCYHAPTLRGMAQHYQTGAVIPDELIERLQAARTYRAGSDMLRQLMFGLTDLALHDRYDPAADGDAFAVENRIAERCTILPRIADDRFLCAFSHIFAGGYAAGYFSYKWAEVLSADAFAAFEEAGLDDEAAVMERGRAFRDTVLARGGGEHPMDVFRAFRGREPSTAALLRHGGLDAGA